MPTVQINLPNTTFVSSAQPNNNLSFYPLMYVGTDPSFLNCISFIQIDLSSIPVTTVDSATLDLAVIVKTGAAPSPIVVNRVTSPFSTSTVTYNTRPTYVPTSDGISVTTADLYQTVHIDITDLVNGWLAGTYPNYGIALTNSDGVTLVQFATNNIVYQPYFPKLTVTYSTNPPVPVTQPYGWIYNTGSQAIGVEAPIPFGVNGALNKVTHSAGSGSITLEESGTYAVFFTVTGGIQNQFALFQNGIVVPGSIFGTDSVSGSNAGQVFVNAAAGDVLSVRNHISVAAVPLDNSAGGIATNVSASIVILKIAPVTSPDPALAAVNAAMTVDAMRAAIEDPALGLDLSGFNALGTAAQNTVLAQLITDRPSLGYPTVASLQDTLDNAVNNVVDTANIYVSATAVDGNGSLANPFGSIQAGINAVAVGGTVHVLSGSYTVTAQINVNKAGIRLLGEAGTTLTLMANVIAILVTGAGATVQGLTITSDVPYQREFIQVGAANVNIVGNTIYGPPQAPPMSNWVVNRALLSQVGTSNISVTGNTFYSLRTGMYINPNTTGAINNNVVYNTKGGFLVDRAFTTFLGNSWGAPPNEFDIVLLVGTTMGPPYDNLAALSAANNGATISDQR